ncbi:aromatic ring-hydroxylating dioxygenase subunit alpha [Noviherbaspirillum sedimenti]|uniref:Aromatic ring-hydroxylating dioxygenase subunit alpha n=1 Tax=Noviherbaspirillum sedimenti TaxID=2320865 RepID=A0A3A3G586_9BURK|nr:aromatic ring-hydroxylating dioxygenase subunit alpha [Noviherbaspirillum sedimenti]RJG03101.1 aromatic ring-hydroxylating dioxygenase subunit alpha [Noviherbaspirillum sedimenti]
MFIYDNWYVAALTTEVNSEKPLARMIVGKPMVFFRTDEGQVAALEDRCMHRGMPLSAGPICNKGRSLQCPYHGLEFDITGACVKAPSQTSIPRNMQVLTYPVVERDSFVWVWTGDPEIADPATIPRTTLGEPDTFGTFNLAHIEYKADWKLIYDNVMDLTHLAYVHTVVNGDVQANVEAKLTISTDDDGKRVSFVRKLPDSIPADQYKMGFDFKGNCDRWQEIECSASGMLIWTGAMDVGCGALDGNAGAMETKRTGGFQLVSYHAITPSTEGNAHYFASGHVNVHLGNEEVFAKMREGQMTTLYEDRVILEPQQARLNETPGRPVVSLAADAAGLAVRRMFKKLLTAEMEKKAPPRPARSSGHQDLMVELTGGAR